MLRMIHEPAAALLAYNIGQESSSGKRYALPSRSFAAGLQSEDDASQVEVQSFFRLHRCF